MRTRVYVAGAYSADNVITILDNMRRGMRVCTVLLLAGYAPFCPWFDYHFQLMLRGGEALSVSDYYEYSIAWLDAAECVYVVPGSEHSHGTNLEIEYAAGKGIKIVYDIDELILDTGTGLA